MPTVTGAVKCLRVNETYGFTTIEASPGVTETFILWFGTSIPPDLTSFTRIAHSMWVSMLREAHANGLTVLISHPANSAAVSEVQLGLV
jgi:hypothetical protein